MWISKEKRCGKARVWELNEEELARLEDSSKKRFSEILSESFKGVKNVSSVEIKPNGDSEGFWILPCVECRYFGKCKYYQDCKEAVMTGKGLEHFKERR